MKIFKHKKRIKYLITLLAAVIVFTTTYALILPAITMESSVAETTPGIVLQEADDDAETNEAENVKTAEAQNDAETQGSAESSKEAEGKKSADSQKEAATADRGEETGQVAQSADAEADTADDTAAKQDEPQQAQEDEEELPSEEITDGDDSESSDAADLEQENEDDVIADSDETASVRASSKRRTAVKTTGASTNVTVNGSLSGTDMKTLGYNLYAYLLASNDNTAYGAKITFTNGTAQATIPNVPPNTYRLYLVYARDNRQLQEKWNYGNVLDANVNYWVDTDGQYLFGYSAKMPADKTITADDNEVSFVLEVPTISNSSITANSILDRAINYGITAESVIHTNNCYTNFATKELTTQNQNGNGGTVYSTRAGDITVPNIIGDVIPADGQTLKTSDKGAVYYVPNADKNDIDKADTRAAVKNKNEIDDRVEIMISNTLKQTENLMASSMLTLSAGMTSVDLSPFGDNATIILDATAISGEQNGFTIVKRPGQTVIFNIGGTTVSPPQNTKVKLVNKDAQQVDINGNPSTKIYTAGDEMRNAQASEGNVWNKIIWNFPDATSVTSSNNIGGVFLVPKGDFHVGTKGGGWIVARGKVYVDSNEWYAFPGEDTPFESKKIRKVFVGLDESQINPDYVLNLWTHTNDSTSGTTSDQLIVPFVLQEADDTTLSTDNTGATVQTGYQSKGTDVNGNIYYEWETPDLAIGSEHKLTENNSVSVGDNATDPNLIEFRGGFSGWNEASQNYEWSMRESEYASESDFNADDSEAVFNVRSYKEDRAEYETVTVTNHYNFVEEDHSLTLTKSVVDPEGLAQEDQEYTFEITLKTRDDALLADGQITCRIGDVDRVLTCTDGKVTVTLKKDENITLRDLPYGTQYFITESLPEKCQVSYSGDVASASQANGRLTRDRSVTAVNTFSDDPGVPVTAHKDLIDGVLQEGQFTFRLTDAAGNVVSTATNDANGNISFGTLTFTQDGEYDYHLYEVADAAMTDIIFDTKEYAVHLTVEGGRVRSVQYDGADTIAMFRNRKIATDSDQLTARKIFIDGTTGKAISLSGGEFTFTATSNDATPIVYTGVNDTDGMVTFKDADGNVVDLNNLTQATTFTIAETDGSYTGTVADNETLTYDDASYLADVAVDVKTVTVKPWTQEVSATDSNTTNLTVTFTPADTSGTKYYVGGIFGAVYSEITSNQTVIFTIPIGKNNLTMDNQFHEYTIEYGTGDNYYWSGGHKKVGEIKLRIKSGDWGKDPVTVDYVAVDNVTLADSYRQEKNVTLTYRTGAYPVFVNRLTRTETTSDFTFTKIWEDVSGSPDVWPSGQTITVTLNAFTATNEKALTEQTLTFSPNRLPEGWTCTQSADGKAFTFAVTGLDAALDGEALTYYVTETKVSGYKEPRYADAAGNGLTSANRALDGQQIINEPEAGYELPSTGGTGTLLFTIIGAVLVLGAGAGLVLKKRCAHH